MRRGQSTLDYVFLIGVAAAGLIVMLVYVSRGLQGSVRDKADQLSAWQYEPGNTTIHNRQTKIADSDSESGSSTTVTYGNLNEPNTALEEILEEIEEKQKEIIELKKEWEETLVKEAKSEAKSVRDGDLDWPGPPEDGEFAIVTKELQKANEELGELLEEADLLEEAWKKRKITPDVTGETHSFSKEEGTKSDSKWQIDEAIGTLIK
ncbi:MAG: hypothetical protein WC574_02970 [Candidatus Omnitrophota bacterium]|jgi:gas vesicle protein